MSSDLKPTQRELLTVAQVATILHVSRDTVRRRYRHRDGVLKYGHLKTPIHRQYVSLRIPAKIVQADIERMSGSLQDEEKKLLAKIKWRQREMDPEKQSVKTLRQADRRNTKKLNQLLEEQAGRHERSRKTNKIKGVHPVDTSKEKTDVNEICKK